MGSFKPLLKYNGETFCSQVIRKLKPVCTSIKIVTGHNSDLLISELRNHNILNEKTECVYNPDYAFGMFTSLQTGMKHLTDSDWIIVHMVDQPDLPEKFYFELVNNFEDRHDWVQPEYNSRKGHPVAIRSNLFGKILSAPKESSLRSLFSEGERKMMLWKCSYHQVLSDIDTPEDYKSITMLPE